MTKSRSAIATVLLCFLLALTLSGCGKSSSAASTTTTTASNIEMAVSAGNQQVTVSWTDPSSTSTSNTTYNVYYSTSPFDATPKDDVTSKNPTVFLIASGVTSPFVHTGLVNGKTYYYFVTKVTGSTDGPASRYAMAVPQAATPAVPTGITIATGIQQSSGAITLTIPNADSSLKYNLYWTANSTATKTSGTKIADAFTYNSSTKAASFTHFNRTNDGSVTYHYVVTAEDEGESDVSKELSVTPHVSASVTAGPNYTFASVDSVTAAVANQQTTLTWTAPDNVNSVSPIYNVYCTTNQTETKIAANLSSTTFIHNGLTNDSTYTYRVTAVYKDSNVTTESTTWTSISVVPQAKVLATPSAVAASKTGDQQVSLSWTTVTDPAGGTVKYNIYYTTTLPTSTTTKTSGGWTLAGTTTATSFSHTGLTIGDTYYYLITSVSDQSGESTATWTSSQVSMEL